MVQRIRQLGDAVLRETSSAVARALDAAGVLLDLRDTLHEFQRTHGFGRGISAIQIGVAQRVIYLEFAGKTYALVNPEYEWMSPETFRLWDDCFSFPDLLVWLERSCQVRVRYWDADGASRTLEAKGALSELLQHEMDHLDGVLAIDRVIGPNGLATREQWVRMRAEAG